MTGKYALEKAGGSATIGLIRFNFWTGTASLAVPGCAMQKYKLSYPVARASEVLADRWTPLIVRELILGSHRFNEIERGLRWGQSSFLKICSAHAELP
jgi:hypothetical protein